MNYSQDEVSVAFRIYHHWKMDNLGLPTSFGKPSQLPSKPTPESAQASSSRGIPSGRGPRGAVGGGKRARGRVGRGGDHEVPDRGIGEGFELNGGMKVC